MKIILAILSNILLIKYAHSQVLLPDSVNQQNEYGQKIGQWETYYNNGQLKTIEYYKPGYKYLTVEARFMQELPFSDSLKRTSIKIGKWTTYYENGDLQSIIMYQDGKRDGKAETYYINSKIKRIEKWDMGKQKYREDYYYNSNWKLKLIESMNQESGDQKVLFGTKIEVEQTEFHFNNHENKRLKKKLAINSTGQEVKEIIIKKSSDRILIEEEKIILNPNSVYYLNFEYLIELNENKDTLVLISKNVNEDEIKIDIKINSFGYHLTTSDFYVWNQKPDQAFVKNQKQNLIY